MECLCGKSEVAWTIVLGKNGEMKKSVPGDRAPDTVESGTILSSWTSASGVVRMWSGRGTLSTTRHAIVFWSVVTTEAEHVGTSEAFIDFSKL